MYTFSISVSHSYSVIWTIQLHYCKMLTFTVLGAMKEAAVWFCKRDAFTHHRVCFWKSHVWYSQNLEICYLSSSNCDFKLQLFFFFYKGHIYFLLFFYPKDWLRWGSFTEKQILVPNIYSRSNHKQGHFWLRLRNNILKLSHNISTKVCHSKIWLYNRFHLISHLHFEQQ